MPSYCSYSFVATFLQLYFLTLPTWSSDRCTDSSGSAPCRVRDPVSYSHMTEQQPLVFFFFGDSAAPTPPTPLPPPPPPPSVTVLADREGSFFTVDVDGVKLPLPFEWCPFWKKRIHSWFRTNKASSSSSQSITFSKIRGLSQPTQTWQFYHKNFQKGVSWRSFLKNFTVFLIGLTKGLQ